MSRQVTVRAYNHEKGLPVPGLWRRDVDSKEILRLRQAGMFVKDIAAKFGIVKSTVCARLQRHFPEEYKKLRVNPTSVRHYVQCAQAYKSFQKLGHYGRVAEEVGCARPTAYDRVKFMTEILQGGTGRLSRKERRPKVKKAVTIRPHVEERKELNFFETELRPQETGPIETVYSKDILDDIEVAGG